MMHVGDTLSTVGDIMHTSGGTMMHVGDIMSVLVGYYGYIFGFSAYWGFQYKGDAFLDKETCVSLYFFCL